MAMGISYDGRINQNHETGCDPSNTFKKMVASTQTMVFLYRVDDTENGHKRGVNIILRHDLASIKSSST